VYRRFPRRHLGHIAGDAVEATAAVIIPVVCLIVALGLWLLAVYGYAEDWFDIFGWIAFHLIALGLVAVGLVVLASNN